MTKNTVLAVCALLVIVSLHTIQSRSIYRRSVPSSTGTHALEICIKAEKEIFDNCVGELKMPEVNISEAEEGLFKADYKVCADAFEENKEGCKNIHVHN